MYRYSNEEMSFTGILNRSVRLHYLTLKYVTFPIFLITLVKYISTLLNQFFLNPIAQTAILIVMWIVALYLFSAALLATHLAFTDHPQSIKTTFKSLIVRGKSIFSSIVVYVLGIYVMYLFVILMTFIVGKYVHPHSPVHGATLIITLALLIMYVAMFSFSIPLAVLDNKTVWKSMRDSIVLTEKNRFGVLVMFLLLGAIILLVSPHSMHEYLLSTYHLDVVFDFIVFCVFLPLLINVLLLMINDSKQKAVGEIE